MLWLGDTCGSCFCQQPRRWLRSWALTLLLGRACRADVGAGYGLLSLAAAARGHRVHAWELGPASLEALEASLAHNGFEHLVQVGRAGW